MPLTVLPALPSGITVGRISSQTARISWSFTHQTVDQMVDHLVVRVLFIDSNSVADTIELPGSSREVTLRNLVPATDYYVVITSYSRDGQRRADPVIFATLGGPPVILSLTIQRQNLTTFAVTINLKYIGGERIRSLTVSHRPADVFGAFWITASSNLVPSNRVGLTVSAVVVLSGTDGELGGRLQFRVSVQNDLGFSSEDWIRIGEHTGLIDLCRQANDNDNIIAVLEQPESSATTPVIDSNTGNDSAGNQFGPNVSLVKVIIELLQVCCQAG